MKKVSVIIPVYNVEKYLNECVDSVLSQTYQNFEIILVDDGSTDKSGDICDKYASDDDRIKVVHKENGGLSDARNCGLKEAQGEYIYFLDSDDFICETALEEAYTKIEKEKCDFVFFDALSFTDENSDYSIKQNYVRKYTYDTDKGIAVLGKQLKNKEYHSSACMMLIDTGFLRKSGITFLKGILYEDMLFTYSLYAMAEKVCQLSRTVYHRRYRSGSIMTSRPKTKNFLSVKTVLESVTDFNITQKIENDITAKAYSSKCAYNVFNMFRRMEKEDRAKVKSEYSTVKLLCKDKDFFGDKALKMMCRGYLFWFVYKAYKKTVGRVFTVK